MSKVAEGIAKREADRKAARSVTKPAKKSKPSKIVETIPAPEPVPEVTEIPPEPEA